MTNCTVRKRNCALPTMPIPRDKITFSISIIISNKNRTKIYNEGTDDAIPEVSINVSTDADLFLSRLHPEILASSYVVS